MARRSRLSRNLIRRSKQNLVLTVVAVLVLVFIFLRYGLPLIGDTSFFFGQLGDKQSQSSNQQQSTNQSFVSAPQLDPLPPATKNKTISVTGNTISGLTVELFLNGSKEDEAKADDNGDFKFSVDLSDGENIVKARTVSGSQKSDFSDSLIITYKKSDPNLTIDNPHDGDNLSGGNTITVSGKTDPGNSVTVNDFLAITDSSGNWSYDLTLVNGGNDIKAVATDPAGNITQKSIHINYSP